MTFLSAAIISFGLFYFDYASDEFDPAGTVMEVSADTIRVDLEEIRIEAARRTETPESAPFSVSTIRISEERRLSAPGLTLVDPLRAIPGVWVNDRNNNAVGERISVRGMGWRAAFGVRGVNMMLDGVPLTMPDGQAIMSLVDPAFIRDVEVIRGPVSGFWGNAGGGAILLSTAAFSDTPMVQARLSAGSFGYNKADLEASFSSGGNRYMIYGSRLYSDGFRDHSRYEAWRLGGHADFVIDDRSRLRVTGAFLESPVSDNPGALTASEASETPDLANPGSVNQNARKITRHAQLGARFQQFYDAGELSVQTYGLVRRLQNPLAFAWIQVDRFAGGIRSFYRQDQDSFSWGIGADAGVMSDSRRNWRNVQGDQGDLTLDQQEDVYTMAGFGRISVPLGDFTLSGGIRYDWFQFQNGDRFLSNGDNSGSRRFSSVSPVAGISYAFREWIAYLNYSTGFETPTTTELVNRPDMTGGFNPELNPERSNGLELGTRGIFPELQLRLDVSGFVSFVDDILQQFQVEEDGRDYFRNAGSTRHAGFEIFADWRPISSVNLISSYSFSDFRFTSDEFTTSDGASLSGNLLPGIPQHRISAMLSYQYASAMLRIEGEFNDKYFVNNANSAENEAYTLFNANLSYSQWSPINGVQISPFFQLNNIFDTRYNGSVIINGFGGRFFEPAPGRNWQAGFSMRFS
ncbi:MAG: TonB-dependent receptor [Balneolales bacterium]|nr:TonB-dependent receptor [Balneolales bacterium]